MFSKEVGRKHWAGEYGGMHGAIARDWLQYGRLVREGRHIEAMSARSSTFHSYAGHLRARGWHMLPAVMYWSLRAMHASDMLKRMKGLADMSAEELDVRQSIMRACRRYSEAQVCISAGLAKVPQQPHTPLLLRVGLAAILLRHADKEGALSQVQMVKSGLGKVENKHQKIRIHRIIAELFFGLGEDQRGRRELYVAERMAEELGARDQALKIRSVRRRRF